jgi:hypothetical protein
MMAWVRERKREHEVASNPSEDFILNLRSVVRLGRDLVFVSVTEERLF